VALLGKKPTKLLALMLTAALACAAAVLLVGSAPANAAKPPPAEPLVITDVEPDPGAKNVRVDDDVIVSFNQTLHITNIRPNMHLTNVETGEDVHRPLCYSPGTDPRSDPTILAFLLSTDNVCGITEVDTSPLECDTTYEVTVSGKNPGAVEGFDGGKLSEDVPKGMTFESSIASWTFTTVRCR
jgi:hypothetical protein